MAEMLSIYVNDTNGNTFQTERRRNEFVIAERNYIGRCRRLHGRFKCRTDAENRLATIADNRGYKWSGKQED